MRSLFLLATLAFPPLGAGCAPYMCQVTKVDDFKAKKVPTVAVVPYKFEYEKWLVKPERAKDAEERKEIEEWNKNIVETYGKLGRRVAEAIAAHVAGAKVVDEAPKEGYYVHGVLWKIAPGKRGLRIAAMFIGREWGEEGKVETRFTCWLKAAGSNESLATYESGQEDPDSWSGGYEAVWDHLEMPIWHFCRRLQETCPEVRLKK